MNQSVKIAAKTYREATIDSGSALTFGSVVRCAELRGPGLLAGLFLGLWIRSCRDDMNGVRRRQGARARRVRAVVRSSGKGGGGAGIEVGLVEAHLF